MQLNSFASNKNAFKKADKVIKILPGLIICVIIAWIGKLIGNYVPSIGGASMAIFIGMAFGNTLGNKKIYSAGAKFAESDLLSYSIVLLGGTLSAQTLLKLGFSGVAFIALQMVITITFAILIGKKLGFSENFRFLMASGNAVCGSSAIAATAPVIDADDNEKGIAITIVNVTGTVLMLLLPFIAAVVFSTETIKTSALIGGILQSVGQVVASGSLVNEQVKDLSTIFKIVRIIFLIFVVLSFGTMKKKSSTTGCKNSNSKVKVPWYVIGFFMMCSLFTMGVFSLELSKIFKLISNNFEIIALAGIGMRVNFRELIKQGAKASIYALGIATVQILSAIVLITVLL
ncbi:putative sulfate exporter family transporter [Clostridium sp. CX1]|uniref:Sulfate exporter family transporter n=1 Tax=Clostridium tanneri TaxID=3037988 RepID=A0ABU4JXN5_9CLOT|nr:MULTISPECIES: putative sulfate exporter family transporter [unclassified Clostridium]MCT8975118.1 putative sulfate exporter family transporter [Clostridium sp. CX1]MDW8802924.1 putative sulfate exporter family transporter [Clostridium sp. A1-XYC3]